MERRQPLVVTSRSGPRPTVPLTSPDFQCTIVDLRGTKMPVRLPKERKSHKSERNYTRHAFQNKSSALRMPAFRIAGSKPVLLLGEMRSSAKCFQSCPTRRGKAARKEFVAGTSTLGLPALITLKGRVSYYSIQISLCYASTCRDFTSRRGHSQDGDKGR
ncbi:hypothetical protein RRG08_027788 [Elysia crispata]|uniref:Uncharacterized protein n=1 Tax=Elysia crispata TaxID=231223 RepID=A0AAE1DC11_9GAST|nr:hypothetical protein RRG08_027788 [Elysia crispata]